jgi:two-component system phosphate regulon sensor histidine kinase PhoR/two-component system sensor histidine kinase VicK
MTYIDKLSSAPLPNVRPPQRALQKWSTAGIQTKILAPLALLMLLSLIGSTLGFFISANTTRNRILDGQLAEDSRRLSEALVRHEQELLESAELLAADMDLRDALNRDALRPGSNIVLELDQRALLFRDRFRLDQVVITNANGQARVNIVAQSYLSQIGAQDRERMFGAIRAPHTVLVQSPQAWLLVGRAPIQSPDNPPDVGELSGYVYTFLNVSEELRRLHRDLELSAEVQLSADQVIAATTPELDQQRVNGNAHVLFAGVSYRAATISQQVGERALSITLLRSEEESNALVSAGLRVMLISSGLTLALVLIAGIFLARSFTRPILQLSQVAQAVAAGDRTRRANLKNQDEIGHLGQAFDEATATIVQLLEDQARVAGERHAILQSIADGVLAVDTRRRIVLVNSAAATLIERPAHELIGQSIEALPDVEDSALAVGLQHIMAQLKGELTDRDRSVTEEHVALGGRIVSLRSAPIVAGDAITGAVVVLQDITRAVESDRAKSEFIATASHELRTPLTGLVGYVDLLRLDGTNNLTDNQRLCLTALKRQTGALTLLVNDLLEMARIERGNIRAERRWVSITQTVDEVITSLHAQATLRGLNVAQHSATDLPLLWIDVLHLRRILTNLVENAIKYTYPNGHIQVHVYQALSATGLPGAADDQPWPHKDEHSVVIEVRDDGVGINEADQPKIFTRFFRSFNPLSTEAGGTGLGLAITKALVLMHDGQIGFWSNEGQGSCFWIRLPVRVMEPVTYLNEELEQTAVGATQSARSPGAS